MEYKNGSIWKKDKQTVTLQELPNDIYCLLEGNPPHVVMDNEQAGKWQYHRDELPELLKDWKPNNVGTTAVPHTWSVSEGLTPPEIARANKAEQEKEIASNVKEKVKKGKI